MPIYEYYCPECEVEFEKLVRMADAHVQPDCPECGGRHTQKKLSTFAMSGSTVKGGAASAGAAASCGGAGRFS